jgi:hypothetical protein
MTPGIVAVIGEPRVDPNIVYFCLQRSACEK